MVRTKYQRFAFTMIELIFAIVIIAITVLSLPMITRISSQGIESNIDQEAIFAASAEILGATAGYWDENSMQDINVSYTERVIDGIILDQACNANRLKPGHINQPGHRRCLDSNITAPTDVSDGNITDLDDQVHGLQNIFPAAITQAKGYKDNYTSTLVINRDANSSIKIITVSVFESVPNGGNLITSFEMQSANIGSVEPYKRSF